MRIAVIADTDRLPRPELEAFAGGCQHIEAGPILSRSPP